MSDHLQKTPEKDGKMLGKWRGECMWDDCPCTAFDNNEVMPDLSKQYRKKPVIITAIQMKHVFTVKTLEGDMTGHVGDYLVTGTHDEQYPVKKEIFEENYEEVE